jgi:hypothetical protein
MRYSLLRLEAVNMLFTNCPHCGRQQIPFEAHELDKLLECAECGGKFTPSGGAAPALQLSAREEKTTKDEPLFSFENPEPWYYRFLGKYVYVFMWIGIGFSVFTCGVATWAVAADFDDLPSFLVSLCLIWVGCLLWVLGCVFATALILLAVDAARNIRDKK